ncbi:Poly [ADP-ribose] polymerase 6 [Acipenser ruthenus]|uniref:Poly [ADP-ribose] polymerase 6 n=1 Tax=Acipenser ruthenus TaxID=7906 RepID=A0A444V810_ACIRT|nr:Poly [ADP-ribose] polymerase 6 [Acipenser ruthenus]
MGSSVGLTACALCSQGSCAADLYRHPQLDADIEAVKEIYTDTALSVREYGTIDDVDIDLQINISFLDCVPALLRIPNVFVLDLRFGPKSVSVCLFSSGGGGDCMEGDSNGTNHCAPSFLSVPVPRWAGILGMFTSQQWKHLSNDFLKSQQEKRHSWFKAGGTIKKFRAGLSIFSPIPKSPSFPLLQDSGLKGKLGVPELRVTRLMNRSISCTIKNPKGELFSYPPSSQASHTVKQES